MPLPVGIITGTVTWGDLVNYAGVPLAAATVTITPSTDLTWAATGTALFRTPLTSVGVTGSQVLPATDQPGFVAGGVPITGWSYTATIATPGQSDRHIVFQLPTAGQPGVTLDLDVLIPLADSTPGTVVTVPSIVSVNGQTGPSVTLDAAAVGALPNAAPAVLRNPTGVASFRIRNQTDTADVVSVSTGGTVTLNGGVQASQAISSVLGVTSQQNDANAFTATGAAAGIRFGPTAGQTYVQRYGTQMLTTDSYIRIIRLATASRTAASTAGPGASYYDTTLSKPVWSDGTNWRDAAGTIV